MTNTKINSIKINSISHGNKWQLQWKSTQMQGQVENYSLSQAADYAIVQVKPVNNSASKVSLWDEAQTCSADNVSLTNAQPRTKHYFITKLFIRKISIRQYCNLSVHLHPTTRQITVFSRNLASLQFLKPTHTHTHTHAHSLYNVNQNNIQHTITSQPHNS